jgi:hypothetical protein
MDLSWFYGFYHETYFGVSDKGKIIANAAGRVNNPLLDQSALQKYKP